LDLPDMEAVAQSVCSLQMQDGGFSNEPTMAVSATTATAAAVCVLHYLNRPLPESAVRWLLDRAGPSGGFAAISLADDRAESAVEGVPPSNRGRDARDTKAIPDLLSTATALYALSLIGASAEDGSEKHLDYLDSLWSPQGGFRGHWADETVDCEYTYYGLLSLGCLAG
jgi:prenyltransferase beta subunit